MRKKEKNNEIDKFLVKNEINKVRNWGWEKKNRGLKKNWKERKEKKVEVNGWEGLLLRLGENEKEEEEKIVHWTGNNQLDFVELVKKKMEENTIYLSKKN